jgi:hypothetical protein
VQNLGTPIHFAQRPDHERSESSGEQVNRQGHDRFRWAHVQLVRDGAQSGCHDRADHDTVETCCGQNVCHCPLAAASPVLGIVNVKMGVESYKVWIVELGCRFGGDDGHFDVHHGRNWCDRIGRKFVRVRHD